MVAAGSQLISTEYYPGCTMRITLRAFAWANRLSDRRDVRFSFSIITSNPDPTIVGQSHKMSVSETWRRQRLVSDNGVFFPFCQDRIFIGNHSTLSGFIIVLRPTRMTGRTTSINREHFCVVSRPFDRQKILSDSFRMSSEEIYLLLSAIIWKLEFLGARSLSLIVCWKNISTWLRIWRCSNCTYFIFYHCSSWYCGSNSSFH